MEVKTGLILFLVFMILQRGEGQLNATFYQTSCPKVESIVRNVVRQKISQTFVTIPATLRLFFHDCFVEVSLPILNDLCIYVSCYKDQL